ncbi:MAG: EpsI family protein [Parvularculaceae bacterium]
MTIAEASEPQGAPAPAAGAGAAPMQEAIIAFAVAGILLCVCFAPTLRTMIGTWAASSSFHHGFFVAPVALWLILRIEGVIDRDNAPASPPEQARAFRDPARMRAALSAQTILTPRSWAPALLLIVGGLALWLAGRAASVNFVQEAAFVSMLIGCVALIFGPSYARRWAFPLAFLFFMVPFGDAIVPALQNFTAGGVIALLKASGIAATLDGVMLETPAGRFEVAEACAGLNFLIAAVIVGALFAHLSFTRLRKAAAFIAFSAAIALVANMLRVYIVVLIATLSEGRIAIAADHVVFGWFFYGALLFVLIFIGKMFADPAREIMAPIQAYAPSGASSWPVAAGLALILIAAGYGKFVVDRAPDVRAPSFLPLVSASGWRATPPAFDWRAPLSHADRVVQASYQSTVGVVDMNVAYFNYDREGAEIAGHDTRSYDGADWRRISVRKLGFSAFGTPRELEVETIANNSGVSLEAVTLYWLDDEIFADPVSMKLSQTRLRLLGERPRGGVFILAAPAANSLDGARATQSLLSDIEPLSAWLARIDARIES